MDAMSEIRKSRVKSTVEQLRRITTIEPLTRGALAEALKVVKALAAEHELWTEADFPTPNDTVRQARYLIHENDDHTLAVYLNVMLPGRSVPPHNHTTWACIASVEGEEHNALYRRLDDLSVPGHAILEQSEIVIIGPGTGLALMPDDVHSIEIRGIQPIRHLHVYGKALETLAERVMFDPANKTYAIMPIGVQSQR